MARTIIVGIAASAEVIELTPEKQAEFFWDMSDDEQVRFFNHLADISGNRFVTQLQHICDSKDLTAQGRYLMEQIGEYSNQSL